MGVCEQGAQQTFGRVRQLELFAACGAGRAQEAIQALERRLDGAEQREREAGQEIARLSSRLASCETWTVPRLGLAAGNGVLTLARLSLRGASTLSTRQAASVGVALAMVWLELLFLARRRVARRPLNRALLAVRLALGTGLVAALLGRRGRALRGAAAEQPCSAQPLAWELAPGGAGAEGARR
jgi:hypothetical protein